MDASANQRWFADQLRRYGPEALAQPGADTPSLIEARAYTRQVARHHYENFPVLSVFVPKRYRQPMADLYAYCRWADDLSDEVVGTQASLELLAWWRGQLRRCFESADHLDTLFGVPPAKGPMHPVMVALKQTADDFGIPPEPLVHLIEAFEQDQRVLAYEHVDQLRDYCRKSADPVGRLMLHLMGRHNDQTAHLSDWICTGLQLTNFWQDVARDAQIGRFYLPANLMAQFGVEADDLIHRRFRPAFAELLKPLVDDAEAHFAFGEELIDHLSGRWRVVIAGFVEGGRAILRKIRACEYDVLTRRPRLSKWDKLRVLGRAVRSASRRTHRLAQGAKPGSTAFSALSDSSNAPEVCNPGPTTPEGAVSS